MWGTEVKPRGTHYALTPGLNICLISGVVAVRRVHGA